MSTVSTPPGLLPQAMEPIAVIGIGCMFPQADNPHQFWTNIKTGVDAITKVPESHWRPADYFDADPKTADKVYAKMGGFLSPVEFSPMEYGILPNALEATDSSQLLGLLTVDQALKDAGYATGKEFDRDRVSVILGVTGTLELVIPLGARLGHPHWRKALQDAGVADDVAADVMERIADSYVPWQENSFPGLLGNVVAGRISKHFDFGGTNCVVDAACGSSLSALNLAALELAAGRSDMVITGGVDTFNDIFMYTCFSKTPALSPGGHAKPYSDDADGTTLGEGLGVVVLKRLADAKRDGDRIYAVVKGIGASSDGRGAAIYEPDANGQCLALRRAYEQAQVTPETIELIEGHGTGTKVGDAIEVSALHKIFGEADKPWCALGSIKSQIGHTKAAAGAAGLIKATLALYNKVLPPTIKVHQPPASLLSTTTPFYVNTAARPWLSSADHLRRAGVSALGFGGSNFHCLLEEYQPEKQQVDWPGDVQIVPFCGPDRAAVKEQLQSMPQAEGWNKLRAFAKEQRSHFDYRAPCRLLLVVEEQKTDRPGQFRNALKLLETQAGDIQDTDVQKTDIQETPDGIFFSESSAQRQIAFLYPGQGAQYPSMLKDLALHFPEFLTAVDEADRVFSTHTDMPRKTLADLIYPRPLRDEQQVAAATDALRATEVAQPALGAVNVAATAVLGYFNLRPAACAGHSYGELVALATAGVFSIENLHRLSRVRGELMAAGSTDRGTMLAVSASLEEIAAFIDEEQLDLVLANRNTPRQGVLSGAREQIEKAHKLLQQRSLSATPLTVSAAFHSPLVADATEPFAQQLTAVDCTAAVIPVYSNTQAQPYPRDLQQAKHLLAHQLAKPVNFVDEIKAMYADGIDTFIEVGPGARLTGMVKAILEGLPVQSISLDASVGKRSGLTDLARLLARAAALGVDVTLTRWDENFSLQEAPIAGKKRLTVTLSGANYFKKPQARPPKMPASHVLQANSTVVTHSSGNTPMTTFEQQDNRPPATAQTPQTRTSSADTSVATEALRLTQQNIEALQTMQQQTAKLHQQYLEGQQAATRSFMTLIEQQRQFFTGSAPEVSTSQRSASFSTQTTTSFAPATPNRVERAAEMMPEEKPKKQTPTPEKTEIVSPMADNDQITNVLLEVIAEKTGYPVEMLELGMSLDADLGIDSIKRVEILSALQEKLPELPAVRPEDLGVLQTLGQIVEHLQGSSEQPAATASVASPAAVDSNQVTKVLVEVIAEKTGYPVEMLELGMSLDADLGIDSIKRVEILSALQEKLPELPAIKPEHLGTLQTIIQIVDFLTSVSGSDSDEKADRSVQDTVALTVARQELKLVPLPKQRPRKEFQFKTGSEVWLTDDGSELINALCSELTAKNLISRKIKLADLDSMDIPASLSGLLVVAPLKGTDELFIRESFRLLQKTAPALQNAAEQGGALFTTISRLNGCFGLQGRNPVNDPLSGGLAGLSKTAALEWPTVHCKTLDLSMGMEVAPTARLIVDEIFTATPREVGITSTGLQTLELVSVPLTPQSSEPPVKSGDLIVISGGARGVTAAVAIALAQECQPVLALLGRSPLPEEEPDWLRSLTNEAAIKKELLQRADTSLSPRELQQQTNRILAAREIRNTMERILKTGATPLYRSVDVCDGAAVDSVITELEQLHGPVKGIIHGAGVLSDKLIVDKTPEQFAKVYATKVSGCRHLLSAIDPEKLRFLVMFSSSTGRFGRVGQVDYAVANEVLNKLAQQHRQNYPDCHVLSLNWGPWDGGMVTPALKKMFTREGVDVIDLKVGANYLVQELSSPQVPCVELVISGGSRDDLSLPEPEAHQNQYVSKAFDLELDIDQYPFLKSHVIDGKAVLPVAMMIEWLAHAAIHSNPGLKFQGLNDLRVLKGVVLESEKPCTVQAMTGKAIKSDGLHMVPVELSSTDQQGRQVAHVRARVVLAGRYGDAVSPTSPTSPLINLDLPEYPHTTASIYQSRRLFHGKDFHGIREVTGCASEGIGALVAAAPAPVDWIAQPLRNSWFADPLVLDSSFQLLILWSFEMYKSGSLPVFINRYRQYQERFPATGVEIRVEILEQTNHKATSNIDFIDPVQGTLVARLEKYECVIDASLNATFQRNRLSGVA